MLSSRSRRLALVTPACVAGVVALLAPAASAATQRYAGPAGSGTACSRVAPCTITQAIAGASSGDEVIVDPGDYPLTATLDDPAPITIHGVAGRPRPRLLFSGGQQGLRLLLGSVLRHVEIDQADPTLALYASFGATVDRVVVHGSAGSFCTAAVNDGTMRNSIVVTPGAGSAICTVANSGTISSSYRNVTAIATGIDGVGIEARGGIWGKATVDLVNVIAKGGPGGAGLVIDTDGPGAAATIAATHTNFANYLSFGPNTLYVDGGGNQGTPPSFVQPAAGDYRQAAGSVTIGAGLDEPIGGAFDVDGDPRTIGTTDIGADEFVVAPTATTRPAGAVTDRSATLNAGVGPNGAPTGYRFEYGATSVYGRSSPTSSAGSGTAAVPATAILGGLSPATTYHFRVVATNAGGTVRGGDQTFRTAATAPPATAPPTPAAPAPATPAQPFAGVTLVSARLSLARGFITLKLRCPAGTAGRCSGRTKLTARRGRTGSHAASTVTVGRATFSIAAGRRAKVRVRAARAGRRLLDRAGRLRGRATQAARDGAGRSRTTVVAVTIRRRP